MKVVAHYKGEAAKRVLLVRRERLKPVNDLSDDQETTAEGNDGDIRTLAENSPPDDEQIAVAGRW
jgi:hypothetical protein